MSCARHAANQDGTCSALQQSLQITECAFAASSKHPVLHRLVVPEGV